MKLLVPAEARGALRIGAIRAGFGGRETNAYAAALILKALGMGECRACQRLFRQPTSGPIVKACSSCKARARAADVAADARHIETREDCGEAVQ